MNRTLKTLGATLAGALLALPLASQAGTLFRFPMSMLSDQCANGGCVVSAYMDHAGRDYACGTVRYSGHTGTDYALAGGFTKMDYGVWVISAAGGTLESSVDGYYDRCNYWNQNDPYAACGLYTANYMIMRHADGRKSKYWHLKKGTQQYARGASIPCGNWIARVGSSGASTGPHLHFEFWDPTWGTDDPYAGSCGGPISLWTSQGAYRGLPGITCQ
ncbi:M23 family metallopeptidase [Archangium sp. Cb G35]|uniref:M23 family metallopeptidase n=1 Tax=Archangium sp. Cb G35 TaxID=1920190 RepID=UPI000A90DEE9|nr:M23 family metallopeptidase [Archangium sp. Cb G35]